VKSTIEKKGTIGYNHPMERRFGRRGFNRVFGLGIPLALALAACDTPDKPPLLEPINVPGSEFDFIRDYYPELGDKLVTQAFSFSHEGVGSSAITTIYSFAGDRVVDPNTAKRTFEYFYSLSQPPRFVIFDNQSFNFTSELTRFEKVTNHYVVIIPKGFPPPKWGTNDFSAYTGHFAINHNQEPVYTVSVIKTGISTSNDIMGLAVEACNATVRVNNLRVDKSNNGSTNFVLPDGTEVDDGLAAQEVICNSLGLAFANKQLGFAYPIYRLEGVQPALHTRNLGFMVDEEMYASIPQIGSAISQISKP